MPVNTKSKSKCLKQSEQGEANGGSGKGRCKCLLACSPHLAHVTGHMGLCVLPGTKRRLDTPALLAKKRDGEALTEAEIRSFIRGVVAGDVGLDQVGAFLMATYVRGTRCSHAGCSVEGIEVERERGGGREREEEALLLAS